MASELANELRNGIDVLNDLGDDELDWLVANGEFLDYQPNEKLFNQGDGADWLYMFLRGEVQIRMQDSGSVPRVILREREVSGVLPYSRMQTLIGTGVAVSPTRVFRLARSKFPEMLKRIPILGERLVAVMTDRVRENTMSVVNRDKLVALGKLSAGLAHELNNPASAGFRAARTLCETLGELRRAARALEEHDLPLDSRRAIRDIEERSALNSRTLKLTDPLARADAHEATLSWLEAQGVGDAWKLAPSLADAGLDPSTLDELHGVTGDAALSDAVARIASAASVQRLASEIESATSRISELIRSIKEYSYMDQAPVQNVDVHKGIESTLQILAHELKLKSIVVEKEFAKDLPEIQAFGAELNQVWTNLIDNAIDAMSGGGHLLLRTSREGDTVVVEVIDDGAGIPPEARPRIFEPFFTTKPFGQGTGLGLDAVFRIVQKHHGDIQVESAPGRTRFCVRLPIAMAG